MTYIYTIPFPNHLLKNEAIDNTENQLEKEYKDRPVSPFDNNMDIDEFVGLFAEINIEGLEEKEAEVCIYIAEENKSAAESIIKEICEQHQTSYSISELENKNWNEKWESSFQPILIEDFVFVRATFHEPNKTVQHEIIIEPKMSFGTGHHPTTSQMIQNMRLLELKDKTVLDCGSGTGILAILAEKLGAKFSIALDNDEWCFQNCIENIELNNCEKIQPEIGDLEKVKNLTFDIILANIHRNFLVEHMHTMAAMLNENGTLIVSGFYSEDVKLILDKALEHHLIANYHSTQQNWDCIVFQK
ncbi:MAG TPA: 50S ribosomal protein L11 methyltransferase [Chitinophagales bacterium]|nr:50S ribosomal protein L11 methyltransferase [Chitinophagales bacterium]